MYFTYYKYHNRGLHPEDTRRRLMRICYSRASKASCRTLGNRIWSVRWQKMIEVFVVRLGRSKELWQRVRGLLKCRIYYLRLCSVGFWWSKDILVLNLFILILGTEFQVGLLSNYSHYYLTLVEVASALLMTYREWQWITESEKLLFI